MRADLRNQPWLLILLCFLGLAPRLTYLLTTYQEFPRHQEMERAAASLAVNGFIGDTFGDSTGKSAHVAPLYPFLLAGIYLITGTHTRAAAIAQGLLTITATTIGILLLPLLARKAGLSLLAGGLAAAALAVMPLNLWIESSGQWEQPLAALAMIGLVLAFCTMQEENWKRRTTWVLTGVLIGLTALLSPALLPAVFLMFVAQLLVNRSQFGKIFAAGALALLVSCLVTLPWMIRNYFALGGFVPLRSNFGLELYLGNHDYATGREPTPWLDPENLQYDRHPFRDQFEFQHLVQVGERTYMQEKMRTALDWISTHPGQFLTLTLRRFLIYFAPPVSFWKPSDPLRHFKAIFLSLIAFAALVELGRLLYLKHSTGLLFASAIFGSSLIYFITHVEIRYRYPIFALLVLLTCNLLLHIYSAISISLTLEKRH
jgi:hypothetical protein